MCIRDRHSNIFAEYLSSVIAKLPKENPEYQFIEERIEELYKEYQMCIRDRSQSVDIGQAERASARGRADSTPEVGASDEAALSRAEMCIRDRSSRV